MKALMMALKPGKDKDAHAHDSDEEEGAPESKSKPSGGDYKAEMKEAASDGDWDAFVDALCAYIDQKA